MSNTVTMTRGQFDQLRSFVKIANRHIKSESGRRGTVERRLGQAQRVLDEVHEANPPTQLELPETGA